MVSCDGHLLWAALPKGSFHSGEAPLVGFRIVCDASFSVVIFLFFGETFTGACNFSVKLGGLVGQRAPGITHLHLSGTEIMSNFFMWVLGIDSVK